MVLTDGMAGNQPISFGNILAIGNSPVFLVLSFEGTISPISDSFHFTKTYLSVHFPVSTQFPGFCVKFKGYSRPGDTKIWFKGYSRFQGSAGTLYFVGSNSMWFQDISVYKTINTYFFIVLFMKAQRTN